MGFDAIARLRVAGLYPLKSVLLGLPRVSVELVGQDLPPASVAAVTAVSPPGGLDPRLCQARAFFGLKGGAVSMIGVSTTGEAEQ